MKAVLAPAAAADPPPRAGAVPRFERRRRERPTGPVAATVRGVLLAADDGRGERRLRTQLHDEKRGVCRPV